MQIKGIIDEDFVNYRIPSMYIAFPKCSFKCGSALCQNSALAKQPIIEINPYTLVNRYINNKITGAIVCAGLEPFDSFNDLKSLVATARATTHDPIIIYTGYTEDEINEQIKWLSAFSNIIVKFGRYMPNQQSHYDETLGVNLASDNQYARRISNG